MHRTHICSALAALACVISLACASVAQTRTTPVEVENSPTVKIDASANLVRSEQNGEWAVEVIGTPSVNVAGMPAVDVNPHPVTQGGEWNVGLVGTPPVATPTVSKGLRLWTSDQVLPQNTQTFSASIDCAGYREVKVVISFNAGSGVVLKLFPEYYSTPGGMPFTPGGIRIAPYFNTLIPGVEASSTVFALPVLSPTLRLLIQNQSTTAINATIDSTRSWVWLTN